MKLRGNKIKVIASLGLAILVLSRVQQAHADTSLIYAVDHNTAAGGVYARSGPHTDATQHIPGYGAYPGDEVQLICGVTDGDPVGPYNNRTWHFISDLSNPGEGNFWLNDHYLNTPNAPGNLAPGEEECSDQNIANPEYYRTAAVNWALDHAEDTQTHDEECAYFVSQALWAGGLQQTDQWNGQGGYRTGNPLHGNLPAYFSGTETANVAPDLIQYLRQNYSTDWKYLGSMNASNNNVPEAQPGDIIAYSWHGDGHIDHLAFIVGAAADDSEYPLVAE